jgi:hypothetical protein
MDGKALATVADDLQPAMMAGMFSLILVVLAIQALQSTTGAMLEATTTGYPAVAGNTGLVWIQMTPLGQANQVRIISENSTGAFEEVLLGVTT